MRLKLIACKIITRETAYLIANSNNNIDVTYLRKMFHNEPDKLRKAVQEEIDLVESGNDPHTNDNLESDDEFDAILIGYGLCSNGIQGLKSSKYPLVIPRAHDCITFFLGSKERYKDYFAAHAGTYWYTQSWLENSATMSEKYFNKLRKKYVDKGFDEDAIEYLMDFETSWIKEYNNAAFISVPEVVPKSGDEYYKDMVKKSAALFGWGYEEITGDISLLKDFVEGNWHEDAFIIIPPGQMAEPSHDENIIKAIS